MVVRQIETLFNKLASKASQGMGTSWAFSCAILLIVAWAAFGPSMGYSDTWELIINTSTTIVTFLMVFLIQNSQNRDARAIHLKLDELIFCMQSADNKMLNIEKLTLEELDVLAKKYESIAAELKGAKADRELGVKSSS